MLNNNIYIVNARVFAERQLQPLEKERVVLNKILRLSSNGN